MEQVETYGYFTPCFARSLIGKMGTHSVYLHYVLDIWFQRRIRRQCRGEAYLFRFADDFLAGFQYQTDAEFFRDSLGDRLGKFHLELAEEKTR